MKNHKSRPPKLQKAIHIPFMEIKDYLNETYGISTESFWADLCDNHMFKGNDTSMPFYYQFAEEIFPNEVAVKLNFIDQRTLALLSEEGSSGNVGEIIEKTLALSLPSLVEMFKDINDNQEQIVTVLGKEYRYYFGYLISGLMEAIIIKLYEINDYDSANGSHFWYFSW